MSLTKEQEVQLKELLAIQEAEKKAETEKATKSSIKLTEEFQAQLEEASAKLEEKLEAKYKKFRLHGSSSDEKELTKAQQQVNVVKFINAVAHNDHQAALSFGEERAKALNITNGATGEYLVPEIFETEILSTFDNYDEIIRDADVRTFNKPGNKFNLNELDTRVSVFWVDENSTGATGSTPSFSEPQIAIADLIGSTDWTQDFEEDTEADFMDNLAKQYGEQMAMKVQARAINGDATVSGVITKGIFNVAGANDVAIANTASGYTGLAAQDMENLYFSAISIDHFQNANMRGKFYMAPLALQALRSNVRTTGANKDFISVFESVDTSALGKPIVMTNQAPTPATTVSNPFVVYGDLSRHLKIRRKRGLTMKINRSGTSLSGRNLNYQLGGELVVSQRIGMQVVLVEGLSRLVT